MRAMPAAGFAYAGLLKEGHRGCSTEAIRALEGLGFIKVSCKHIGYTGRCTLVAQK